MSMNTPNANENENLKKIASQVPYVTPHTEVAHIQNPFLQLLKLSAE